MKKNKGQAKKKRSTVRPHLAEPRTPYGEALTPEDFDRTLRKVSRRLSDVKKQQNEEKP